MSAKLKSSLIVSDLKLNAYLGVTAKERKKKQVILVSIKIGFYKLPAACKTEKIIDTVCYDELAKKLKVFCDNKKFILMENLCHQLFLFVKKNIIRNSDLFLSVTKLGSLKNLKQSTFEISD